MADMAVRCLQGSLTRTWHRQLKLPLLACLAGQPYVPVLLSKAAVLWGCWLQCLSKHARLLQLGRHVGGHAQTAQPAAMLAQRCLRAEGSA